VAQIALLARRSLIVRLLQGTLHLEVGQAGAYGGEPFDAVDDRHRIIAVSAGGGDDAKHLL